MRLSAELQASLAVLFGWNDSQTQGLPSRAQAHAFLLAMQTKEGAALHGSSWLALVSLLFQSSDTNASLFATQALWRRYQRLDDPVDVELEGHDWYTQLPSHWTVDVTQSDWKWNLSLVMITQATQQSHLLDTSLRLLGSCWVVASLHLKRDICEGVSHPKLLTAVPETLSSLSMDPRILQPVILHWRGKNPPTSDLVVWEAWARLWPIQSFDPIRQVVLRELGSPHPKAALLFLLAVVEGGSWTHEQVVASVVGLTDTKRKSSRSKKRHQAQVDQRMTEDIEARSRMEVEHRGQMSCQVTSECWEALDPLFQRSLQNGVVDDVLQCIAASATACLPYLLCHPTDAARQFFYQLFEAILRMCRSSVARIRLLSLDPLSALRQCAADIISTEAALDPVLEPLYVHYMSQCAWSLAEWCSYPVGYFKDMGAPSDEELEFERNDIRDLLRSIASSEDGGSTSSVSLSRRPHATALSILGDLLKTCSNTLHESARRGEPMSEPVVHTLSALAKPLNHLAKFYAIEHDDSASFLLYGAIELLTLINDSVLDMFSSDNVNEATVLTISRTANIAVASFSPMLASLNQCGRHCEAQQAVLNRAIAVAVKAATLSIERIPELLAPSQVHELSHGIRGAMRGPGGEDHVGCLAIMRLVTASEELARLVAPTSSAVELSNLCLRLKTQEIQRGHGIIHGSGVTTKSRRILVRSLCDIEVAMNHSAGSLGALSSIFESAIQSIVECRGVVPSAYTMHTICEGLRDLCALSTPFLVTLLEFKTDGETAMQHSMETAQSACLHVYQEYEQGRHCSQDLCIQWNRLRAALSEFVLSSTSFDIAPVLADMVMELASKECSAIEMQCATGCPYGSWLFSDDVVSPEAVPAGLLVHIISTPTVAKLQQGLPGFRNLFCRLSSTILTTISSPCMSVPDGVIEDPRCTLAEAWFLAATNMTACAASDTAIMESLVDCFCACLLLVLGSPIRSSDKDMVKRCMSMDGPHTLAFMEFLIAFCRLGPSSLLRGAQKLSLQLRLLDESESTTATPIDVLSMSIVGSAVFRMAQGGLPPWALEFAPDLFSALYDGVGCDPGLFARFLRVGMDMRSSATSACHICVRCGSLLSGPFFDKMSDESKDKLISDILECSHLNTKGSWRRVKVLVKQACGGKKKDTEYRQKPSPTRWDFERI